MFSYMPDGLQEIGIQEIEDFNSGSLLGAQYVSTTIDPNGEFRASSQETFLTAAANRTNLKVFQLTMAKKIIFDSRKKATGVQVAVPGMKPFTLTASHEIVISAGAFQSPQMLMVSGIGPKSTLQKFGIPVIVDNSNVGEVSTHVLYFYPDSQLSQNMWDHTLFALSYPIGLDSARLVNVGLLLWEVAVWD